MEVIEDISPNLSQELTSRSPLMLAFSVTVSHSLHFLFHTVWNQSSVGFPLAVVLTSFLCFDCN